MIEKADEYNALIKQRLRPERYQHSLNVADEALELAVRYDADTEKAYICGLLHDVKKNSSTDEQLALINKAGIILPEVENKNRKLWHAPAGAAYIKLELGIDDRDMFNAIMYHTTARAGMSILEKRKETADDVAAERDYPGVEVMREKAHEDINEAIREGTRDALSDILSRRRQVNKNTVEAYNEMCRLSAAEGK